MPETRFLPEGRCSRRAWLIAALAAGLARAAGVAAQPAGPAPAAGQAPDGAAAMRPQSVPGAAASGADADAAVVLRVGGAVARPLSLTRADLAALPQQRLEEVRRIEQDDGRAQTQTRRYAGVLLRDLLDLAGLPEAARDERRRSVAVATAGDGYRAVFSYGELYLSPAGERALVAIERDGAPLDARGGPVALVSLADLRTGPRHVRDLRSIEVVRVSGAS